MIVHPAIAARDSDGASDFYSSGGVICPVRSVPQAVSVK
jgi:hypothetical protein